MGGNMIGWGGGWGGGSMFGIAHLLWWILVIVAIVPVVRLLAVGARSKGRSNEEDRALGILKERYARGEIDKAGFEARKRDIA